MEGPPRGRLVLIALVVALAGGALALLLALATGAVHSGTRVTTVIASQQTNVSSIPAQQWSRIYAQTAPGTVDITVQSVTSVDTPFGGQQDRQQTAVGSGFVIDGSGDILTAAHVVQGANSISVKFHDNRTRTAKVLGVDNSSDVALVRVDPSGMTLHPVALGSSSSLAIGDELGVIGSPLGFQFSLSTGIVSGLDRTIQAPNGFTIAHAVQTDAAMNPGNSGGPILDASGRVVGIADQIATGSNQFGNSTSDTNTGVGFAVPIELAKSGLTALQRGQTPSHAYLGVSTSDTTNGDKGALVGSVQSGGAAAKAGLRSGDVIVSLNGKQVNGSSDLIAALAVAHPGDTATLVVARDGSRLTVTVKLAAQPAQAPTQ